MQFNKERSHHISTNSKIVGKQGHNREIEHPNLGCVRKSISRTGDAKLYLPEQMGSGP